MPRSIFALAACLGIVATAFAQRASRDLPRVGERVPDVVGYDAAGERFELSRLRGKHAVIVFGCLT